MTKLERAARRLATGMGFTVVSSKNVEGHHHLILAVADGTTRKLTFAGSPRCPENSLQWLSQDLRRLATDHLKGLS